MSSNNLVTLSREPRYKPVVRAAFRLLKFRPRSENELSLTLQEKGFHQSLVKPVVRSLVKSGYLDDRKFARLWGEFRKDKLYGLRKIEVELKAKGVKDDVAAQAMREIGADYREKDALNNLILKKLAFMPDLDKESKRRRILSFLYRRGFEIEMIQEVLDRIEQEIGKPGDREIR